MSALISRVAEGSESAFGQLYDELSPLVYSIARRVLTDHSLAEEVTQEVFVLLWQQAARFDADRGRLRSWVAVMAHRKAVDRVRSTQSARERDSRASLLDREDYEHVEEQVIVALESESVRRALAELSDAQREAIELAYFTGMTYPEVAHRLNVPLGTVKTRMRDGLRKLRTTMGGSHG